MHILIATPYLPWPLDTGGKVAQFFTLECLNKDHSFTVICPIYSQKEAEGIKEIEQRLSNVKVKGVPLYDDNPTNYSRMRDFLRSVLNGIRQLLPPKDLNQLGAIIKYPYYPFAPLPASFIKVLSEEMTSNVDLLQVEFAEMLSLGAFQLPTNIPKIFIIHQVHWIYTNRHLKVHGFDPYSNYLADRILLEESMFLSGFDSIVVFSDEDAKEISTIVDRSKIYISPFSIPVDIDLSVAVPSRNLSIENFTFVGSETHGPNQDALDWLLSDIWPLIRAAIPQAQLFIIGNWGGLWRSVHRSEGVVYTGFVENIAEVMHGTIHLVPVRIGSGIRTKILTAMALKIPVVSTTIGIEGIKACDLEQALIRDTADDFARGAITLATNPTLADRLANEALEFIRNNYSSDVVRKTRNSIYETIMSRA
jgi:polysaccharide biosynthesis protein PslH